MYNKDKGKPGKNFKGVIKFVLSTIQGCCVTAERQILPLGSFLKFRHDKTFRCNIVKKRNTQVYGSRKCYSVGWRWAESFPERYFSSTALKNQ